MFFDVPAHEIQGLEERGTPKKSLMIHSPATGYVIEKSVLEGAQVMPGAPLFRIADLSNVWVLADVYQYELAWVKPGLPAEVELSYLLLYLDVAYDEWRAKGKMRGLSDLREAIDHGAVKRVRPKIMTAATIIAGLIPILWSHGAGADVMKRIAAPMVGGVVTSVMMELAVYPVIYYLWKGRGLRKEARLAGRILES